MLESYRQELAAIRAHYGTVGAAARRPPAAAPPSTGGPSAYRVGDLVRVLRPGPLQGVVAEVEFVGSARLQIRVAGELYAAPYDAVEAVPVSA
jgi:hypothetical protein